MMTSDSSPRSTVLDLARDIYAGEPDRPLYAFLDGHGRETSRMTYGEFYRAAARVGRFLTEEVGLEPRGAGKEGDRAVLVFPPSLDFAVAFVGCIYAGLIPVPVAPPNPFRLRQGLSGLESVIEGSGSRVVLSNGEYLRGKRLAAGKNLLITRGTAWSRLPWHRTDNLPADDEGAIPPPHPAGPGDVSFLQYTSGSTSAPKGVMISHGNIMHQLSTNAADLGLDKESRAVLWVPHFHDFCLVSGILSAFYGNGLLYLLSPLTFLRRPSVWFEVMSRVAATHTAAPDFAYRLALRRTTVAERKTYDLGSLRVMMSAAEPIRPSTVDPFLEAFADSGLRPEAFCPAYGLAEHTVGISVAGTHRLRLDRQSLEHDREVRVLGPEDLQEGVTLLGCGKPPAEVVVRVVDPETLQVVPPGGVGEIWVDSPSKALGYWALPELSSEVFDTPLEGEDRRFLRTGDLGFLADGEVFVTGRLKDLIIVRGRNIFPQDLEETAAGCSPHIRPGRVVAFAVEASGDSELRERVVVVAEVGSDRLPKTELAVVARSIRTRLHGEHQVACYEVLVTRPGEILKTTSGKLQRQACRLAYQEGRLRPRSLWIETVIAPTGTA